MAVGSPKTATAKTMAVTVIVILTIVDNDVVFKLPAKERKFDFLGVVLNSRKSDRVKQLLEQSPMPEMLQSFIGAYQWFHMLILLMHLTFMIVFTYYSVKFLDTVNEAIAPNRFVHFVFGHKRNNGAFLVWPAMMCASHLFINILKGLQWFGYCRCSDKQLHKNLMQTHVVTILEIRSAGKRLIGMRSNCML
jgi:hypothetical protein